MYSHVLRYLSPYESYLAAYPSKKSAFVDQVRGRAGLVEWGSIAGVDNGLRMTIATQHHQEIGDHGRAAIIVKVDDVIVR